MADSRRKHDYLDSTLLGAGAEVMDTSSRHRKRGVQYFVQELHEDGNRWVNLRSFDSEADARAAMEVLGRGSEDRSRRYRVHKTDDPGGD